MKKIIFILVLILVSNSVNSQFYKKHEDNKLKFYGTLDFRNSIINHNVHEYYGLKLGAANKSLRFGVSYHVFHKNLFKLFTEKDFLTSTLYRNNLTNYHLFSVFSELIIHQTERWELLFPIHVGVGDLSQKGFNFKFKTILPNKQNTNLLSSVVVSTKANYRIVKWAGLTSGLGYNVAFSHNKQLQKDFSAIFYSFGIKLFFDEIGKLVTNKEYRNQYGTNTNFVNGK